MYSRGDGVMRDFEKAREWLTKAAAQGDAQRALSDLPERAAAGRSRDQEAEPLSAKSPTTGDAQRDVTKPARRWKFWS